MEPYSDDYYDSPIGLLKKSIDHTSWNAIIDIDTYNHICLIFGNPLSNTVYSVYRPTYRYLNNLPEWDEGLNV